MHKTYFAKFFLIVLTLLVAGFISIGSLSYKDSLDKTRLTHQQELGITYLLTLSGIMHNVALHQHKSHKNIDKEVDTQFQKLRQLHNKYAHRFFIADHDLERQNKHHLKLTSILETWSLIRSQSNDHFLHINLISQLRELTEIVFEQSRVSADVDPKISYISEMIWLKIPENTEIISKLVHAEYVQDHTVLIAYLKSNLEGFRENIRKLRFYSQSEEQTNLHYYIEAPIENIITNEAAFIEAIHLSPPDTVAATLLRSFHSNAQFVGEASNYLAMLKLAKAEQANFYSNLLLGAGGCLIVLSLLLTFIYSILEKKKSPKQV